jgi:xanthine dehydrogenase accessory factor
MESSVDDMKIYQEIVALHHSGEAAALVTIVESSGSAPRKAGAKMLVFGDGSTQGSIGGGRIELETIEAARAAIDTGVARTISFVLTKEYGHVCGGQVLAYIEPVMSAPHLLIIGAGHVGKALATAAGFAGFRVQIADERQRYTESAQSSGFLETFAGDADATFRHFAVHDATFVVIATSGFQTDFDAVRAALKTPARYIGVIGSQQKREVLEQTLTQEGYAPAELKRLTIPMGLSIGAQTPEEIAVSIVSQLIQSRRAPLAEPPCESCEGRDLTPEGTAQETSCAG